MYVRQRIQYHAEETHYSTDDEMNGWMWVRDMPFHKIVQRLQNEDMHQVNAIRDLAQEH